MADTPENNAADIDTDSMSMEQLSEIKTQMRDGVELASKPQDPPAEAQQPDPAVEEHDDEAALAAAEAEAPAEVDKGSKTVPHKTFNYANERRKAAEKERDEFRERYARLEERTKLILEGQAPAQATQAAPAPEAPAVPDPEKDPVGALKWLKEQMEGRDKAEAEKRQQAETQQREQAAFTEVYNRVNADYASATAADPEVQQAHNALRQSLGEELLAMGYTQADAIKQIAQIEDQHILHVGQSGQKIGDYIKRLAGTRGWKPAAPAQPENTASKVNDKLEQARQAGASLGTSGGAVANAGKITPDMLADMPEDEFRAYMEKHKTTRGAFAA